MPPIELFISSFLMVSVCRGTLDMCRGQSVEEHFYKGVEYGITGGFEHTQKDCAVFDFKVGHSGLEPETSVLSGP
jgi:hypothetical protein